MRISDWSSDVCSSDLHAVHYRKHIRLQEVPMKALIALSLAAALAATALAVAAEPATSPEVIKQFPTTLTDAGKQFLDRCSDEQLAAATDPLIVSRRCKRPEEEQVGKEGGSKCRSRWARAH